MTYIVQLYYSVNIVVWHLSDSSGTEKAKQLPSHKKTNLTLPTNSKDPAKFVHPCCHDCYFIELVGLEFNDAISTMKVMSS